MSTGNKAPRSAHARLAKTKFNINKIGDVKQPVVEKIDISSLQVDESADVDCDPYNSTGQFMVVAGKEKHGD